METWLSFQTIVNALFSSVITILFALYNSVLGIRYKMMWNGYISVYYYLLTILRAYIVHVSLKYKQVDDQSRNQVYRRASLILIALNISLIIPLKLMILDDKNVTMTLRPALWLAVYTLYKVIMAFINRKVVRHIKDVLVKLLRNINFIDALISLLTLQNTLLVIKKAAQQRDMLRLSAFTTTVALVIITGMTVWNVVKSLKRRSR